jgi:hypothetical protein
MNRLKTKWVNKWAKKHRISDDNLIVAIENLENNLSSSNLGGGLFKVRIASQSGGKSGGFRTLIVYKEDDRAVVVYGFAKNEQENLSKSELLAFKILSKDILNQSHSDLEMAINKGVFIPLGEEQ